MDRTNFKASDALLTVARVWLFLALGALLLYFVVAAIESSSFFKTTVHVHVPGYQVPIEREEEKTDGDGG